VAVSKLCKVCNISFVAKRTTQVYCSRECAKVGIQLYDATYYEHNKEKRKAQTKLWHEIQGSSNTNFKLARNIRSRFRLALKGHYKTGSAVKELGCSIEEFKVYLESKFEPWMNWTNYGKYNKNFPTWQIDHVIPLALFDLTKPDQIKTACNYSNLQPMLAKKNLQKGKNNG
jgi:hypothetical protein